MIRHATPKATARGQRARRAADGSRARGQFLYRPGLESLEARTVMTGSATPFL